MSFCFEFQTAQTTLFSRRLRARGLLHSFLALLRGRAERRVPDAPLACARDAVFGKVMRPGLSEAPDTPGVPHAVVLTAYNVLSPAATVVAARPDDECRFG